MTAFQVSQHKYWRVSNAVNNNHLQNKEKEEVILHTMLITLAELFARGRVSMLNVCTGSRRG